MIEVRTQQRRDLNYLRDEAVYEARMRRVKGILFHKKQQLYKHHHHHIKEK